MTTISLASSLTTGATCLMAYGLPCHLRPKAKLYRHISRPCLAGSRAPCGWLQPLRRRLRRVPALVPGRVWINELVSFFQVYQRGFFILLDGDFHGALGPGYFLSPESFRGLSASRATSAAKPAIRVNSRPFVVHAATASAFSDQTILPPTIVATARPLSFQP
jgi:hypothetical protein